METINVGTRVQGEPKTSHNILKTKIRTSG